MRDGVGDPSLAFIKMVRERLVSNAGVLAFVGDRIYAEPPHGVVFPWIRIGATQTVDDGVDCGEDSVEAFQDLHVWSRAAGVDEVMTIASVVKAALHKTTPTPSIAGPWVCVDLMVQDIRHSLDPDGRSRQAILTVRALLDPA